MVFARLRLCEPGKGGLEDSDDRRNIKIMVQTYEPEAGKNNPMNK